MNYKKWIIPVGSSFILGVGLGWIAKGDFLVLLFSTYLPALVTLLAAYYGAKFAFDFQMDKELEEKRNSDVTNGNLAIFKLLSMLNTLLAYQKQIIEPHRGKPTAFLEMDATHEQVKEDININVDKISFLLNTVDRNLLGEITVEMERFKSAMTAINERSSLHRHEIQPVLESKGIVQGGKYTLKEIENALGERLFISLNGATEQVVFHVESTIDSIKIIGKKLTSALKREFPDSEIMEIAIPKT